jgi:CBS domain-containing protein
MQVADVMKTDVRTTTPEDTFAHVARLLHDNQVSSIVVMDADRVAGIVTERDLVNLVADGLDPASTKVGDRMSTNLDTVEPRTDIAEAAEHMARLRIRHLPVVENGRLAGIISIRDLTNWAVEEMTGGHELADMQRGATTLTAAAEVHRATQ